MYSLQALWSQAREHARVLTIICANSSYAILKASQGSCRAPAHPLVWQVAEITQHGFQPEPPASA